MMFRGSKAEICILGAGVVGLSTAQNILEKIPSCNVTIIADKFLSETLSFGAGGFFRPEINIGRDRQSIEKWARDGYEHYHYLAQMEPQSGNTIMTGYQLSTYSAESMKNELVESIISPPVRKLTDEEMKQFSSIYKYGIFWTSIITDPRHYLPYLHQKIRNLGGQLVKRHVRSFDELFAQNDYDLVVNCTGLEASKLTGDHLLIPVRGQAFKVKADWIKNFYFADGAYVLPGRDYVTVGGIKEFGSSNMAISKLDSHSIWTRCLEIVPSLSQAEIAFEWVGLRPHRQPVRVESETICLKDGRLKNLVHNYGHGAHGVTLSWGTAQEATRLALDILTTTNYDTYNKDNKLKSKL